MLAAVLGLMLIQAPAAGTPVPNFPGAVVGGPVNAKLGPKSRFGLAGYRPERSERMGIGGSATAVCALIDEKTVKLCKPVAESPQTWGFAEAIVRLGENLTFEGSGLAAGDIVIVTATFNKNGKVTIEANKAVPVAP